MNEKEFRYEFTGTEKPRGRFLKDFSIAALPFLDFRGNNGFLMFLNEVVKNIYDHAEGKGFVLLEKEGLVIRFMIKDYGTESYDLAEIKKAGSKKPFNGVNYGAGICMNGIEDLAKGVGIVLQIDTSCGFTYTGTYPIPE